MAHILFSVGIKNAAELAGLMQRLNNEGMPTVDLSAIEAAQVRDFPTTFYRASCRTGHIKTSLLDLSQPSGHFVVERSMSACSQT